MTNEEFVKRLPRKSLAELLIVCHSEPEYDKGFDGEWYQCGARDYYRTSDGLEFCEDYDDALQHECWWLAQQYDEYSA